MQKLLKSDQQEKLVFGALHEICDPCKTLTFIFFVAATFAKNCLKHSKSSLCLMITIEQYIYCKLEYLYFFFVD